MISISRKYDYYHFLLFVDFWKLQLSLGLLPHRRIECVRLGCKHHHADHFSVPKRRLPEKPAPPKRCNRLENIVCSFFYLSSQGLGIRGQR